MAVANAALNEQLGADEAEGIEVSVVLACLNEEESVAACVNHAKT